MVPEAELPVLESLVHIRNRLTALKKDRTEYLRAKDVLDIYASLMTQVTRLNEIRTVPPSTSSSSSGQGDDEGGEQEESVQQEENRVDTILNDVFQLLSLFFLRIGKSRESPATFCQLGTMKRLLTHLNESGIYTEADLKPYQTRLSELKSIIREGDPSNLDRDQEERRGTTQEVEEELERDKAMTRLMFEKWDACDKLVKKLSTSLTQLSPELYPLHQRLITLRRSLASIAARPRPQIADLNPILTELRGIEEKRNANGKFVIPCPQAAKLKEKTKEKEKETTKEEDPDTTPTSTQSALPLPLSSSTSSQPPSSLGAAEKEEEPEEEEEEISYFEPPKGQELLAGLLQDNFDICQDIKAREGEEDVARGPLQAIYDRLSEIKAQLERLVLTHRWTLRETDLYNFQNELSRVDALRVDGKFRDSQGNVPEGQIVLLYLLRRCYGLCYRLMASSEPVSEELMPIANKLNTIKRCLIEVAKQGGPFTPRDLYPFQLALYQIDSLRKEGKFEGRDGSIPEGQAILNALLSEAHEIIEMMLLEEEE
ncbi:Cub1p [Sporobolomyces salmoneus]|uniref:Cub1p n=1 Tax=Sporobolomyces salmoneus TaxID=183962 RepID=UPI003171D90A